MATTEKTRPYKQISAKLDFWNELVDKPSTTHTDRRKATKVVKDALDRRKHEAKLKARDTISADTKAKIAAKKQAILKQQVDAAKEDLWGGKKAREAARANFTEQSASKQGSSPTAQNNTSTSNSNNTSSNQANAKTNTGNQTTANQPQNNNVSKQPSNNPKSTPSTGSAPVTQKPNIWSHIKSKGSRIGIPIVANIALDTLNSTSPTQSGIYEPLWDQIKNTDDGYGYAANLVDAVLSPTSSKLWDIGIEKAGDFVFNLANKALSPISDLSNNTDNSASVNKLVGSALGTYFKHNVANIAKNYVKDGLTGLRYGADYIPYLFPPTAIPKVTRDTITTALNNIWDTSRDFEDIKDYSYKNLGFDDYIGDSIWRGAKAGFNNLFSRFGENKDFYQRGRYSLNEMLSTIAKDIENHKDKNSPEYKDLVDKFERFNNLAKSSDFYWATKKEMDASDLSKEDFLKSKNLAPETFDYLEQTANTLHNLGSNLDLNESNGNKRSDYVEGNYSYQDYTDAVNAAKKGSEEDNTDIDTDTLNAAINMGTDVGKAIVNKPVDTPTGTGTNNTANENSQSGLTPDYLTEFYKKFDKKYNYDPAKGRFNIWL